jgi:hypothetical protein
MLAENDSDWAGQLEGSKHFLETAADARITVYRQRRAHENPAGISRPAGSIERPSDDSLASPRYMPSGFWEKVSGTSSSATA